MPPGYFLVLWKGEQADHHPLTLGSAPLSSTLGPLRECLTEPVKSSSALSESSLSCPEQDKGKEIQTPKQMDIVSGWIFILHRSVIAGFYHVTPTG